ncbi:hypothetical protein [Botrimarina mediterranea]|uniref:Uncharacterized protein n=1 Tax=Botrimarina mediterranea TaxID=2528022 RepID=A0A518KDJ4_9BACT|nr:hypothetical protein [Botrimarina mediterranea]QDV75829.1 hypothetical protein Spa11_40520 [Botrimarina mediterranea]QDV80426.1 hypothetical protein K2D_40550 [Planctomycetes bacterium K2D]
MDKPDDLDDDMRPEYDLENMEVIAVGKYAERIRKEGVKVTIERTVAFDEDVEKAFPTSEAVNQALRSLMNAQAPSTTP